MKIGLVTGEFPPMQGGVGAFTAELAREMNRQGHEIHVITSRLARPENETSRRLSLSAIGDPIDLGYAKLHPRGRRWTWRDIGQVADVCLRYDLDLVDIQYEPAAYNMRSAAINFAPWRLRGMLPVVVTFHDLRVPYLFPKAGRLRQWVVYRMARMSKGVIVTNSDDQGRLKDAGIASRNIPIGSNVTAHQVTSEQVADLRAGLGLHAGDCLLAYFGFMNESKGAETLLNAMVQQPEGLQLVFIGGQIGSSDPTNEAYFQYIRDLIERLGLQKVVHWTGFLPDESVSAYFQAADLVILPYQDGVSLRRGTLMAALAHGRPIISTLPQSPVPELSHGETIWLVPPMDPVALANAITELAAEPALRAHLAEQAVLLSARFSWARIARETLAYFQEVMAARKGSRAISAA
jgi:glycosyltransferase involved in cell wall biosynthesis